MAFPNFCLTCVVPISFESRITPRYFTSFLKGMLTSVTQPSMNSKYTIKNIFNMLNCQLGRRRWSYRRWYIKWVFKTLSCLRARWACILPSSSEIRSNFCSHCPSKEAWWWRVISKLLQQGRNHNWCGKYRVRTL